MYTDGSKTESVVGSVFYHQGYFPLMDITQDGECIYCWTMQYGELSELLNRENLLFIRIH